MCDKNKVGNKDYSFWLQNEMDDYYLDAPEEDDVIVSLQTKYDKEKAKNLKPSHDLQVQPQKAPKKTYSRDRVKFSPSFNFNEALKGIPDAVVIEISFFLDLKDLAYLFTTCKFVKERFDQNKCWIDRTLKDFLRLQLQSGYLASADARQVYRYLHYIKKKSELRFESRAVDLNSLWLSEFSKTSPPSSELSKNLIDSVSAKSPLINHYIYQMIPDYYDYCIKGTSWQPNLNLSWLERRSGVQLWLCGVIDHKPTAKTLRPIRLVGNEIGQKAYISEGKYLMIESKVVTERKISEIVSEEEKKSDENQKDDNKLFSFTIADLEETLKDHCMNSSQSSLRYCFQIKSLEAGSENTVEKQVYQQGTIIQVSVPKEDLSYAEMGQTISKEGLIMFFTKNTSAVSLFIFDAREKDSYFKVSLNLEGSLNGAFLTKKPDQNAAKFTVFLVDDTLNIYSVTYSQENELKISNVCLKHNKEEEDLEQEGNRKGIFKVQKRFHHEILPTNSTESLIIFQERTFYLINLETLKFASYKLLYNSYDVVYDWTVYNGGLYVLENTDIVSYRIYAEKPTIYMHEKSRLPGTSSWRYNKYSRRWISMNSCYTIFVDVTPHDSAPKVSVEISIISTEYQVKGLTSLHSRFANDFIVKLDNFLDLEEYEDRVKEVADNMNVKIEDNTVVVQTSQRSFFVNLEAYRKPAARSHLGSISAFSTVRDFKVLQIAPEEDEKKDADNKTVIKKEKPKYVVDLNSICENQNHAPSKNQKPKKRWSGCNKKAEGKEEREQDRVIRQKGDKYYKNVRHKQNKEKFS